MAFREELESLGINVAEGANRVMGDEEFYWTMLGIFVDTVYENKISLEEFDAGDTAELTERVHMMKGMTGNLSITPLFESYTKVLGLLRDNKQKDARAEMEKLMPVQAKIVECIEKNRT